jgi:putative MATE family efflux protein
MEYSKTGAQPATQQNATPPGRAGKNGVDLLNGPIDSTLRIFALPLAFSFLVNMLYSWIDTYFVSKIGAAAIAAIGVSEQLSFLVFNFGSGLAIGTGIIVARRIGEGNKNQASYTATQGIVTMLVFSTVLAVLLRLLLPVILHALGLDKDPQVFSLTEIYLSVLLFGVPGNFVTFQINAIVRSTGNSMYPMMILLLTTITNAILAPLLIFGLGPVPALGMLGAGLATAIAQLLGGIISLSMVITGRAGLKLQFRNFRPDFELIMRIVRQGLWSTLQMFSVSISRLALFKIAAGFDPRITVAAYTLGLKVDLFAVMSVFAVGIAVETATGQNLGARKIDRIFAFHRSAVRQLIVLLSALAIMAFFLSGEFAGIYTGSYEASLRQAIVGQTVNYLHIASFGYIFFAIGFVTMRVISGAGATMRSMMIVAFCLIGVQVPAAYILAHYTGLRENGIWVGVVLSYIVLTVAGFRELKGRRWLGVNI